MEIKDIWQISISAISALATLLAVFVALWQTKYSNRKKIKIECSDAVQLSYGLSGAAQEYCISLKAVNVGNREVILVREGIRFSNGFELQIVRRESSFPTTIKTEGYAQYVEPLLGIKQAIYENRDKVGDENKKMKFFVEDTTGKRYFTKTKHTIAFYFSEIK